MLSFQYSQLIFLLFLLFVGDVLVTSSCSTNDVHFDEWKLQNILKNPEETYEESYDEISVETYEKTNEETFTLNKKAQEERI